MELSQPPSSTVHSNSKSNVAGRIDDREVVKLTRPHRMPALLGQPYEDPRIANHELKTKFTQSVDDEI